MWGCPLRVRGGSDRLGELPIREIVRTAAMSHPTLSVEFIVYALLERSEPFKRQRPQSRSMAIAGDKKVIDVSGYARGIMVPA